MYLALGFNKFVRTLSEKSIHYYKFATYARIFHSKHITDLDIDNFLEQVIDHLIQHHIEHKNDELLQM